MLNLILHPMLLFLVIMLFRWWLPTMQILLKSNFLKISLKIHFNKVLRSCLAIKDKVWRLWTSFIMDRNLFRKISCLKQPWRSSETLILILEVCQLVSRLKWTASIMHPILKKLIIIEAYQNMRVEHGWQKKPNLMAAQPIIENFQPVLFNLTQKLSPKTSKTST